MSLEDAIAFAAEQHKGQTDKGGHPYILHPLRVMLALEGQDERIAALLHDTVEDCGVGLRDVEERFGANIAAAVDALTKRENETYEAFIERCGANAIARTVKAADLRDNSDLSRLKCVTDADRRRARKYRLASERLDEMSGKGA